MEWGRDNIAKCHTRQGLKVAKKVSPIFWMALYTYQSFLPHKKEGVFWDRLEENFFVICKQVVIVAASDVCINIWGERIASFFLLLINSEC